MAVASFSQPRFADMPNDHERAIALYEGRVWSRRRNQRKEQPRFSCQMTGSISRCVTSPAASIATTVCKNPDTSFQSRRRHGKN